MEVFLFSFTVDVNTLYVTNDNTSHTYSSTLFERSAIECKEFTYDLKEIVGEVSITIPWEQCGFLRETTLRTLEGAVALNVWEYDVDLDTASLIFQGFVNSFKASKAALEMQCVSFVEFARDNSQRMCLTRHCNHRLYSSLCTLIAASYTYEAELTSVSYDRCTLQLIGPGTTQAGGYYKYGYVRMGNSFRYIVSDSYNGVVRTVDVLHPAPAAWTVYSTVYVTAGCDKTSTTCTTKFNNFPQFLGFPYAPYESIRFTGLRGQETQADKKGK